MEILYSPRFRRDYKKLDIETQHLTKEKLKLLLSHSSDPRLKIHKLTGGLKGYSAFSINHTYRVICKYEVDGTVRLLRVGTHDIYDV